MIKRLFPCILLHIAGASTSCILDITQTPVAGETQMWSPLFQASWDKLHSLQPAELTKVIPPNPLIDQLQQFTWEERTVMPESSYATFAGKATESFALETQRKITQDFGIQLDLSNLPSDAGGNAAVSVLKRTVTYSQRFYESKQKPLLFKQSTGNTYPVKFFGTTGKASKRYRNKVSVLAHEPEDSTFTLSIGTTSGNEKVIIYLPSESLSFQDAIHQVAQQRQSPLQGTFGDLDDRYIHENDTVKIPYLTLNATNDFTAMLQGYLYYGTNPTPWRMVAAKQYIEFNFTEREARIISSTSTGSDPFGGPPECIPRNFICDRPFFIFLWRNQAKQPYFAAWIDSMDGLSPFKKRL